MNFEQIILNLLAKMGISPEMLKASLASIVHDANLVKSEVIAAKAGFSNAAAHFDARLRSQEELLREILERLPPTPQGASADRAALPAPEQLNGKDHA